MDWPTRPVRVLVPATSANLGPGFDALGLALTRYDEVTVAVTGSGLSIEVSGEGAAAADAGEDHLVVRAMREAFKTVAGESPTGLILRCVNAIPQGRGLGSSAGAVVAGLLAGQALAHQALGDPAVPVAGPLTVPGDLLALATALEGHPDNAAACLAGGLTIAWSPDARPERPRAVRLEPVAGLVPVACVPRVAVATTTARRALPPAVPHRDAAANAGRAALLVAALTQDPTLLLDATRDWLHEPYRAPLMPASADLIGRLRAAGIAAVLSGAGPTVLALTVAGLTPESAEVDSIAIQTGNEWHVSPLDVDRQGATVSSVPPGVLFRTGA